MVPRGRVELPTPAFSGPRSTGELPRHRHNQGFYGKRAALESENGPRRLRDCRATANRAVTQSVGGALPLLAVRLPVASTYVRRQECLRHRSIVRGNCEAYTCGERLRIGIQFI